MLSSLLLVLRETLEAALIVGIVAAATRLLPGAGRRIALGLVLGALGAGLVALMAERIGAWAEGVGMELFNAGVLLCAALMIAWHVVWMAAHARELSQQMRQLGQAVSAGARPLWALTLVVALSVLREGSEVVLFLYGLLLGGAESGPMLLGSLLGLGGGALLGLALYRGLRIVPMQALFRWTNVLLVLLAAGLVAQAARFLNQADWLPSWGERWWDSSWLLSEQSLIGQALHTLIGYQSRPMGIEIAAYLGTLVLLTLGWILCRPAPIHASPAR